MQKIIKLTQSRTVQLEDSPFSNQSEMFSFQVKQLMNQEIVSEEQLVEPKDSYVYKQQIRSRSPEEYTGGRVKDKSIIQYYPVERIYTQYEERRRQVQVPVIKHVTDYYAIESKTDYIPRVFQEKVTEYKPVDRYNQKIEYHKIEKQTILDSRPMTQSSYIYNIPVQSQAPTQTSFDSRSNLDSNRIPLGIRSRKIID